jgi:hypothetical protein
MLSLMFIPCNIRRSISALSWEAQQTEPRQSGTQAT